MIGQTIRDYSMLVTLCEMNEESFRMIETNGCITEGGCLLIKDIFSPVCDDAGNVDLNKSY